MVVVVGGGVVMLVAVVVGMIATLYIQGDPTPHPPPSPPNDMIDGDGCHSAVVDEE